MLDRFCDEQRARLDKMISKEDLATGITNIQNQFKIGMDLTASRLRNLSEVQKLHPSNSQFETLARTVDTLTSMTHENTKVLQAITSSLDQQQKNIRDIIRENITLQIQNTELKKAAKEQPMTEASLKSHLTNNDPKESTELPSPVPQAISDSHLTNNNPNEPTKLLPEPRTIPESHLTNEDSNKSAEQESSEVGILGSDDNSSRGRSDDEELDFSDNDTQSTVIESNESSPVKDPSLMVDSLVMALSNDSSIPSPIIHPTTDYDRLTYNELQQLAEKRKLSTTKMTTVSLRALLSANDRELSTKSTN